MPADDTPSDTQQRFVDGDVHALKELWEQHATALVRFLRTRCRAAGIDHSNADEIAQDTYLKAHQRRDQFKGGNFRAWLFTIAANRLLDVLRKKKPQTIPEGFSATGDEMASINRATYHEEIAGLQQCIAALDDKSQTVVRGYMAEIDKTALANQLGIAQATVYTRYLRAIGKLRACLEGKQLA